MVNHIRLWNKWRKCNANSFLHKVSVLFGLVKSPTFEVEKVFSGFKKEEE